MSSCIVPFDGTLRYASGMDGQPDLIFETALDVVTRYGMKRTTMADIARGAGISRKTLYDRFGDKDGIMAAMIDHYGERLLAELRSAFHEAPSLADKIDAYYDIAVWPMFDLLAAMPDSADLEEGMGPASREASERVTAHKRVLLTDMLRPYPSPEGQAPETVARFFEQSTHRAKKAATERGELSDYLQVLKLSMLAIEQAGRTSSS